MNKDAFGKQASTKAQVGREQFRPLQIAKKGQRSRNSKDGKEEVPRERNEERVESSKKSAKGDSYAMSRWMEEKQGGDAPYFAGSHYSRK